MTFKMTSIANGAAVEQILNDADASGAGKTGLTAVADLDSINSNGFFRAINTTLNTPVAGQYFSVLSNRVASDEGTQVAGHIQFNQIYFRRQQGGIWQPWQEVLASDTLTSAQANTILTDADASNVGKSTPTVSADADAETTFTLKIVGSSWIGSPYSGVDGSNQGKLLNLPTNASNLYETQLFFGINDADDTLKTRRKNNGVWDSSWHSYYHDGNVGNTTFNAPAPTAGTYQVNISRSGLGLIEISNLTTVPTTNMLFYNPNGAVGSITTSGTATSYNTASDNRLKTVLGKPTDADIDAKFDAIYNTFTTFDWVNGSNTQPVWGFLAHDVIDAGLDFGSEGEGDRALAIGDVYEPAVYKDVTTEQPVFYKTGAKKGEPKLDADGNQLTETVTTQELVTPEKVVTPAGVDQSKVVPYLVAKIEQLERRLIAGGL